MVAPAPALGYIIMVASGVLSVLDDAYLHYVYNVYYLTFNSKRSTSREA